MDASDEEEDEKSQMKELLDERPSDLEAQAVKSDQQPIAAEYLVSARVKLACLAGYFMLNLCLTIYNKAVLGRFPYPWLITTLHTSFGAAGCSILLARGYFKLTRLTMRSHAILVGFSFLYTINIAISNVSLAMVSTVVTNRLMTGELALPPLEILLRMSPLAALQSLMYASASGELSRMMDSINAGEISSLAWLALAGNGFLAFCLNVSSFQTNKLAGALTISVCSNLKQCLTILLGIVLFDVKVGLWNGLGMLVTLAGAAVYSKVELDAKAAKQKTPAVQEGSS
ncbi:MAG: hypothetical protein Q9165_000911 [Trypethelium subeluteriae]